MQTNPFNSTYSMNSYGFNIFYNGPWTYLERERAQNCGLILGETNRVHKMYEGVINVSRGQ